MSSGSHIHAKAWSKKHDTSRFIASLSGSAQKQQLTLAVLKEACVDREDVDASRVWFHTRTSMLEQVKAIPFLSIDIYPLHIEEHRLCLKHNQSWSLRFKTLLDFHQYFGPKIAIYFGWVEFYNTYLVLSVCISLLYFLLLPIIPYSRIIFVVVSSSLWTLFVSKWKSRNAELEFEFKYHRVDEVDEKIQDAFVGEWMTDSVTKQRVYDTPGWKRMYKRCFISIPIMTSMCLIVLFIATSLNALCDYVQIMFPECYGEDRVDEVMHVYCSILFHGPGLLNVLSITIMDVLYMNIARQLTTFENYRTEREASNELMLKIIPFTLINAHASLLYLALYAQDMERLVHRLQDLMIVSQLMNNVTQLLIPTIISKCCFWRIKAQHALSPTGASSLERVRKQKWQPVYDDTFRDFKEMITQYTFVTWYAVIYPQAALFALCNNYIEVHTDTYKLLSNDGYQRPYSSNTRGIERWNRVLYIVTGIGVVLNCLFLGLFYLEESLRLELSTLEKVMVVVA